MFVFVVLFSCLLLGMKTRNTAWCLVLINLFVLVLNKYVINLKFYSVSRFVNWIKRKLHRHSFDTTKPFESMKVYTFR